MKIAILHLSDLHIENKGDIDKANYISNALSYNLNLVSHFYIVITGDLINYGQVNNYIFVKEFIDSLKTAVKSKNKLLQVQIIIVPGNHDCCFENVKATRKTIIKDCIKDNILEDDYFSDALVVQDDFWKFYKELIGESPFDKVSYKIEHQPHLNYKIIFHCYNSSWMSEEKEVYGNIVMPENKFITSDNGFVISLFHHAVSWLSNKTLNNNQARFEEHLIKTSNLVLFGHEHDKGQTINFQKKNNNVVFAEGEALKRDNSKASGFSYFEVDLISKEIACKNFTWKLEDTAYLTINEEKYPICQRKKRIFAIDMNFLAKLDSLKIPLKHSKKEKLSISDMFIYPDLEPIIEDDSKAFQYLDTEDLINNIIKGDKLKVAIEGDDQSGKTTLLFSFYRQLYENGFLPIYIRGKYLNSTNTKDLIKKAIKEQYNNKNVELFLQQDKHVLFIDNFQNTTLNSKYKSVFLESISKSFDSIIITNNSTISNLNIDDINALNNYSRYKLLPLGHQKRSELISKWLNIGENFSTLQEGVILKNLQHKLDEVNALMGNRLMPSHPIFILTLLQGLDSHIFQDYTPTSYAHCYHALITIGLVEQGLKDLSGYFSLLKELAYSLFKSGKEFFDNSFYSTFFVRFSDTYYSDSDSSQMLSHIVNANILKYDDEYYTFSYKYIYYYLIAQKIAEQDTDNKEIIEDLCREIHLEKNANILIFLSHHTKVQALIDNIIFTSWLPFEDTKPITLDNDLFTSFTSEFVNDIQEKIISFDDSCNPKEELRKELEHKDTVERSKTNRFSEKSDSTKLTSETIQINQTFQAIKILGQIVKNQKGDFEKSKLIELVEAAYNNSFRLVSFVTNILEKEKDIIVEIMCDKIEKMSKNNDKFKDAIEKLGRDGLRKKIMNNLQLILFHICISSLDNLISAVGSKNTNALYENVSSKIKSPIAKITTFAIKSYYGDISVKDLEKLYAEVEYNHTAKNILRFYVRKHLYSNIVERSKKDRIISIVGFRKQALLTSKKGVSS